MSSPKIESIAMGIGTKTILIQLITYILNPIKVMPSYNTQYMKPMASKISFRLFWWNKRADPLLDAIIIWRTMIPSQWSIQFKCRHAIKPLQSLRRDRWKKKKVYQYAVLAPESSSSKFLHRYFSFSLYYLYFSFSFGLVHSNEIE
jgi:hypothetical protein